MMRCIVQVSGVRLSLLSLFGARRFFWHGFHGLRGFLGLGSGRCALGGQAFLIVVVGYISKGAVVRGQGADSCEQVGDGGKIREELKRIVLEYDPKG